MATQRNGQPASAARQGDPAQPPVDRLPTVSRRFGALMIDWVLCLFASMAFADPARDGWAPVVVLVALYAVFAGFFAQTPGMRLCGLRCVSFSDGGRIGPLRGLLRGVLLCLVVPPLLMDGARRGLHDRLARSIIDYSDPAKAVLPVR